MPRTAITSWIGANAGLTIGALAALGVRRVNLCSALARAGRRGSSAQRRRLRTQEASLGWMAQSRSPGSPPRAAMALRGDALWFVSSPQERT